MWVTVTAVRVNTSRGRVRPGQLNLRSAVRRYCLSSEVGSSLLFQGHSYQKILKNDEAKDQTQTGGEPTNAVKCDPSGTLTAAVPGAEGCVLVGAV